MQKIITYENVVAELRKLGVSCGRSRKDFDLIKKKEMYYLIAWHIAQEIASYYVNNQIHRYKHLAKVTHTNLRQTARL